ncbi:hypothetical protein [Amycolatopsis thermoflava]|uniref:hypothetical protein n=1 Tax=Amycolatopsis thermoflava TaxID=84480 RepID=UPI0004125696|nr:hypothetical protein [Amycolatopsis thermoflava]
MAGASCSRSSAWWTSRPSGRRGGTLINSGGSHLVGEAIGGWYRDPLAGARLDVLGAAGLGLAVVAIAAGTALLAVAAGRGLVRLRLRPVARPRLLAGAVGLGAVQDTGVTSAALTPAVGR